MLDHFVNKSKLFGKIVVEYLSQNPKTKYSQGKLWKKGVNLKQISIQMIISKLDLNICTDFESKVCRSSSFTNSSYLRFRQKMLTVQIPAQMRLDTSFLRSFFADEHETKCLKSKELFGT